MHEIHMELLSLLPQFRILYEKWVKILISSTNSVDKKMQSRTCTGITFSSLEYCVAQSGKENI
jgi:hypothetical protein